MIAPCKNLQLAFAIVFDKFLKLLKGKHGSLKKIARHYNADFRKVRSLHENFMLNYLRSLELDLIVSYSAPIVFKKELLGMEREQSKLQASLGGVMDMGGTPDLIVVIDTNKESLAVAEANKLGIPVIAVLDSNSSPDGIDYPIPGNDDAARAIALYTDLIARAALDGMASAMGSAGIDIGAAEEAPVEEAVADAPAEA